MAKTSGVSTSMIKATARERLLGNYGTIIAASIVVNIIYFVSMLTILQITNIFISLTTQIIVDLLFGVFISGRCYMLMNLAYGQPVTFGDLFFGFKQNPDKAILIQLIYTIASLILQIPQFLHVAGLIPVTWMAIGTLVLLIPYIIFAVAMSQTFFLLQDFPDNSVRQLVRKSISVMRHNYIKYICFVLSFVPMMFIGVITFFIPLLWVEAYFNASRAMFYKEIISQR